MAPSVTVHSNQPAWFEIGTRKRKLTYASIMNGAQRGPFHFGTGLSSVVSRSAIGSILTPLVADQSDEETEDRERAERADMVPDRIVRKEPRRPEGEPAQVVRRQHRRDPLEDARQPLDRIEQPRAEGHRQIEDVRKGWR